MVDDPQFEKGMLFKDNKQFKKVVRAHLVKHGRNPFIYKNETFNVSYKYSPPCPWKIYASKLQRDNTL